MRILFVEDDTLLADTIAEELRERFVVDVVGTGNEGIRFGSSGEYNVIILDLNLPDISGHEVCATLRKNKIKTPIIILTGELEVADKVRALDTGADDYLTKPFQFPELVARIRALMRRSPDTLPPTTLIVGDLVLNTATRSAYRAGKQIPLRRKEYDVLECLMRHSGRTVSREHIMEQAWDQGSDLFTNTIDVHIKHLRDKIDRPFPQRLIKTAHGVGYKIEAFSQT